MKAGVDDAVVLPQQLLPAVTTDAAKRVVDLGDGPGAVSHRHNGVQIQGAHQGLGLPQRGRKPVICVVLGRHVCPDLHKPGQLASIVMLRLDFSVNPVLMAIFGPVQDLHPAHHALCGCIQQLLDVGRVRVFAAQQLARCLAQGVLGAVACDAGKAFVNPGDAALSVGK